MLIAALRAPEMIGRDLDIVIEEEIGAVRCTVRLARGHGAARATLTVPKTPERLADPGSIDALAQALSLRPSEIGFDGHTPTVWSTGTPFCFVPITSRAAIERATPTLTLAAASGAGRGAYLYTRETVHADSTIHARMFGAGLGVQEDPATGSAASAFAGVAILFEKPEDGPHTVVIEQGFEMGRPSLIALGMTVRGGRLIEATIGGSAIRVSEGILDI